MYVKEEEADREIGGHMQRDLLKDKVISDKDTRGMSFDRLQCARFYMNGEGADGGTRLTSRLNILCKVKN